MYEESEVLPCCDGRTPTRSRALWVLARDSVSLDVNEHEPANR